MAKVASSLGLAWKSRTSGTVLKSSLSSCTIVYCIHQLLPVDSKCNEAFRHRPAVCASHTCYDGGVWSLPSHDSDCLCLRCRIAALLLLPLLPWSPSSGGAMWTNGPARGRHTGPAGARGGTRIRAPRGGYRCTGFERSWTGAARRRRRLVLDLLIRGIFG
jgi:hypothetical protein